MSEKVEHTAVKNTDPPLGCSCNPSDVYFPCQRHHAFWICENAWLKQRETYLLAERDRLREALREIRDSKFCAYENTSADSYGTGVTDGHRFCANIARAALKDTNQ